MRFGLRKPSLKKSLKLKFSPKAMIRRNLKMPRYSRVLTNPKRFFRDQIYHQTTFSIWDNKGSRRGRKTNHGYDEPTYEEKLSVEELIKRVSEPDKEYKSIVDADIANKIAFYCFIALLIFSAICFFFSIIR